MLAGPADGLHRALEVPDVVERVEDAEDIHAVLGRLVHEPIHDRVLVMSVTKQVLTPQEHLQAGIGHQLPKRAKPLPRVLVEKADAGVVRGASPAFHTPETGLIDVLTGPDHVLRRHARGKHALVTVAKHQLRDLDQS